MKFNRLSASIANNAGEAPSIYMAICMVESLLDDIEDVSGLEIGECPIGDDMLPTKLMWLCQVISQIYEEKSGEFSRNPARLDAAMKELKQTGTELEALSETAARLSAAEAELKKRQAALEHARAEQKEYEKIKEQCRLLQQEADSLRGFDKAAEEAKLRALRAETADMAEKRAGLEAEYASVLAARNEVVGKTAELRSEINKTEELIEQKNSALNGMKQQSLEMQTRKDELMSQLNRATEELSALQDDVARLETKELPERRRQRADEETRKKGLEQALASLELETGQLLEKNQELSVRIRKAEEAHNARYSEYSRLTEDCKRSEEKITALEQRLEALSGKNDAQKHEIYKRQMEDQIAELEKIGQECADMEQELAARDRAIKAKQREAEELSARKAQAEDVERQVSDVLRKLAPIASENFRTVLEENRHRLAVLESVRGNLSSTLADMWEILGTTPVSDKGVMLEQMKNTLQGLMNYTDKLQENLVLYAKCVTLEERK